MSRELGPLIVARNLVLAILVPSQANTHWLQHRPHPLPSKRTKTEILRDVPRIDILLNCAGFQRRHSPHEFPDADWNEVLQVNLTTHQGGLPALVSRWYYGARLRSIERRTCTADQGSEQ